MDYFLSRFSYRTFVERKKMAKVILEFDLYEDSESYHHAINGTKYLAVLQEFDNYLRSKLKYEELPDVVADALQKARDHLHSEASDNGFSLWE